MGSVLAPLRSILTCFCGQGDGPWTCFSAFPEKFRKRCKKETKKGAEMDAFLMILGVFSRKCESAFRLRRRERIEVQAPDFLAPCLHFCSSFFALFFGAVWTCWEAQIHVFKLGRRQRRDPLNPPRCLAPLAGVLGPFTLNSSTKVF